MGNNKEEMKRGSYVLVSTEVYLEQDRLSNNRSLRVQTYSV